MPELPEVETTRRGVSPHIVAREIVEICVREPRLRWPVDADVQRCVGTVVKETYRRGKYLIIRTTAGDLIIHLGMSGSLRICEAAEPPMAHDHFDVILDDGRAMRYRDPRKFGALLFAQDAFQHRLLTKLGPEPLGDEFSGDYLYQRSRGRSRSIKKFIMDAHVVVGCGNIYANEALYLAGIRPTAAAGKVSRQRYNKLEAAIRQVLQQAIAAGGTTLRDFVSSEGKPGYFANELRVYGREKLPCLSCDTVLTSLRIDNRATVYCRRCQT